VGTVRPGGVDVGVAKVTSSVAAMRRHMTVVFLATVTLSAGALAACGSDSSSSSNTGDSLPPAQSATEGSTPANGSVDPSAPTTTSPDKPTVEIPEALPTELVVTVLTPGDGPAAAAGDTVIVDYVGVRSSDGVEFDNSYDRGEPIPVVLGSGGVIPGWEEGLIGAQAGAQIQLDIPSDKAYGAEARGDIIGADEALTFVIDVRSVIPVSDPANEPTEPGIPASEGATEVTTTDLTGGDGAMVEDGQTAVLHLVLFRGDNLVKLDSTWSGDCEPTCAAIQVPVAEGTFPGLLAGLEGMKVGSRRAIVIPPDQGFGPDGEPTIGLPADTDIIMVVDLLGAY
jgi:FKBP-type peptidyl-prolyl cis-trans isomerase